jgi:cytochrome c-type biogenesis protein CcmH/NrfG
MRKIREAASLDPDFLEPIVMLSRFAMRGHSWAEASRYSEAWLRIDPGSLEAAGNIYYCMVITRNHQRIGEAIRRHVALDPDSVKTVNEHAQTYYTNENYVMARAMYETLAEVLVDPAAAYLNLGACCIHLDDVEGTKAAFEAFLEVAPEDHPQRETVKKDLAALDAGGILE